jgi:hypothetical protein
MVVFHRVGDLTLMLDFETDRDALAETLAVAYPWIRSTGCPNLIEVGYTFKL